MFALAHTRHGQGDATRLGKLHAVADEVVQHLSQVEGVAAQGVRRLRHYVGAKLQAADFGLRCKNGHGAIDQAMEVEVGFLDAELAGFDLGDVEHVLDQLEHDLRCFVHRLHHFPLLGVQGRVAQQVVHPDDGVERRTHLVADGGEEPALRLIGSLFAAQGIEKSRHELADVHREDDHSNEKADTENEVLSLFHTIERACSRCAPVVAETNPSDRADRAARSALLSTRSR